MLLTALLAVLALSLPLQAQGKYPIHEDFRSAARLSAPMGKGVFRVGNAFLSVIPKWSGKKGGANIRKEYMEDTVKGWMISPDNVKDSTRCILFIHGGGFVFKGAPYHYTYAAEYARETGCDVFFIDYRMAYDSDYGIPLAQCVTALNVLQGWYKTVSIVGDSAGGFLALKTTLEAETKPDRLCLVYPVVDCSMRTESMATYTDTPVWNAVNNRKMWEAYLQGNSEQSLLDADLSALPPTYIETAEYDCLHDEDLLLAERLREQGVPVTLHETHGTMHGSEITKESVRRRIAFLSK